MYPATAGAVRCLHTQQNCRGRAVITGFYLEEEKLIAVAVSDILDTSGLSAVYTFFDPATGKAIAGQLCDSVADRAGPRLMGLDYLYLGYWIKGCAKMEYKSAFTGRLEMLVEGEVGAQKSS